MVAAAEVAALVRVAARARRLPDRLLRRPRRSDAARELTAAPVVGIGEAAYIAAALVAKRFAVITTLRAASPRWRTRIDALGLRSRCAGDRAAGHPRRRAGQRHTRTRPRRSSRPAERLAADRGAEALDPGLRRHGRRRREPSSARWECPSATASRSARPRPRALALRPSHQQGRRVRGARADPILRHAGLTLMRAATFREYGGPEVMRWEELDDPGRGPDEVLVGCAPAASTTATSTRGRAARAGRSRCRGCWAPSSPAPWSRSAPTSRASPTATRSRPISSSPAGPARPAGAGGPTCASGSWCSAPTAGAATPSWWRCRRGR